MTSIIVAVDQRGGYAKGRTIPWSFQADWTHFKQVTEGNTCFMGRGTYEDIAERRRKRTPNFRVLLPKRDSFVMSKTLTNSPGPKQIQGATVVNKLEQITKRDHKGEVFLLGGFRLWIQYWYTVNDIWMTIVPGEYETNKKFPVHLISKDFNILEGRKEQTDQGEIMFLHYVRNGHSSKKLWEK